MKGNGMRQPTVESLWGRGGVIHTSEHDGELEVFDLYCGAGGFSAGAIQAGCRVAFACDFNVKAIETHKRNHPLTVHWCEELPRDDLPFPQDGRNFHIHGSPPCQQFSKINQKHRSDLEHKRASSHVEWFIDTALASAATSWSMENVAQKHVIQLVERKRRERNLAFSYAVINFARLGVPQSRVRIIAGSHDVVSRLLRATEEQPQRSIQDVLSIPRGTHIRGTATGVGQRKKSQIAKKGESKYTYKRAPWSALCRPLDGPAPTVVGRHALTWITGRGEKCNRSVLYPSELAALQTFPREYRFPTNKFQAYLQIGNAFPPRVAMLMLKKEEEEEEEEEEACHTEPLSPSLDPEVVDRYRRRARERESASI